MLNHVVHLKLIEYSMSATFHLKISKFLEEPNFHKKNTKIVIIISMNLFSLNNSVRNDILTIFILPIHEHSPMLH